MTDNLQTIAANIQGIAYALTLLDSYPMSSRKLAPAIHALHSKLEVEVDSLCDVIERMELS